MHRRIITAFVLVVLAGLLWTFRASLFTGSPEILDSPEELAAPEPNDREAAVARSEKTATPRRVQAEVKEAPAAAKAADDPRLLVLVVFEKSGKPAPRAKLHYLRWEDFQRIRSEGKLRPDDHPADLFLFVEEHGMAILADHHGFADIPSSARGVCVSGTVDTEIGVALAFAWNRVPPQGPVLLELAPARSLAVRIVDSGGKALTGVPVHVAPGPAEAEKDSFGHPVGTTAGKDAVVLVPHANFFRPRGPGNTTFSSTGSVGAFLPGLARVRKAYELEEIGTTKISVTLPATGSIRIRHGAALAKRGRDESPQPSQLRCEDEEEWFYTPLDERFEALFPIVALGRQYRVFTKGGERGFEGPTRAGQELVLDLTDEKTGKLSITLRDSEGKAIDPSPYQFELSDEHRGYKTSSHKIVDRKVLIEAVPVGSQLQLMVQHSSMKHIKNFAGPGVADQSLDIELRLPARPSLRFRLLDDKGKPMREAVISFEITLDGNTSTGWNWRTDKDAIFRYFFKDDSRRKKLSTVRITFHDGKEHWTATNANGAVLAGRTVDLGDMRLSRTAVALEGSILGDDKPYRAFSKPYSLCGALHWESMAPSRKRHMRCRPRWQVRSARRARRWKIPIGNQRDRVRLPGPSSGRVPSRSDGIEDPSRERSQVPCANPAGLSRSRARSLAADGTNGCAGSCEARGAATLRKNRRQSLESECSSPSATKSFKEAHPLYVGQPRARGLQSHNTLHRLQPSAGDHRRHPAPGTPTQHRSTSAPL